MFLKVNQNNLEIILHANTLPITLKIIFIVSVNYFQYF
jgi:hypothetical protein